MNALLGFPTAEAHQKVRAGGSRQRHARQAPRSITPAGVFAFIAAQLAGMLTAVALRAWLWPMGVEESIRIAQT